MAGVNRTTGKATDLITFSRASGGTALRKISYGSELGSDTLSDWAAINGGTVSQDGDWLLITSNQATASGVSLEFPATQGSVYQWSMEIDLLTATVADVQLTVASTGGGDAFSPSSYVYVSSDRTITYTGVCTDGTSPSYVVVTPRGVGLTARIRNISVKEVLFDQPDGTLTLFNHPTNIPRIEYAADGTVKGLLIEEQRVNLFRWTEAFDNAAWINKSNITVDGTTGYSSPDGNATADRIEATAANGNFQQTFTASSGVSYTFSCFVKKADTGNVIRFDLRDGPSNWAYTFNLDTLVTTALASTATDVGISSVGGGWFRCHITATVATTFGVAYVYVPTSGDSFYLWGAQVEAGSFPTSYIKNESSTSGATRSADLASISVDNFGYRQDAGTVVVQQSTFNDVKNAVVWQIDDGTVNNRYVFNAFNGNTSVINGGISQASLTHTGQDVNVTYKHGFGYKLNNFASVYDGGSPVTDVTGTLPIVSTLRFGKDTSSNAIINGHIKSINYYPRRLSNYQLQIETGFAPVITGVPTISGSEAVGATLTASAASVSAGPASTTTWQWNRNGSAISGATSSTYTLVSADVGATITVRQTETNAIGSANATSNPTGTISAVPAGAIQQRDSGYILDRAGDYIEVRA